MQNKAVVNEETANDVNLLREQIRQLKVFAVLMVLKICLRYFAPIIVNSILLIIV